MLRRWMVLALCLASVSGCLRDPSGAPGDPDAGPPADGSDYPPPRTDLVPAVGGPASLDIATWNIENFPHSADAVRLIADLVASMDLDVVAVQEVADVDAWNELVARLPDHDGLLSEHYYGDGTYQKVGFLYRRDLVTLEAGLLLFDRQGYEFPRPPLQALATIDDGVHPPLDLVIITAHLKAGFTSEDRQRRTQAMQLLESYVRDSVVDGGLDSDVLVLGDFNEILTTTEGRAVFDPWLSRPDRYHLHTDSLAAGGAFTYVPTNVLLDHVISTASLADEIAGGQDLIPPLSDEVTDYLGEVSDHQPMVVRMPIFE